MTEAHKPNQIPDWCTPGLYYGGGQGYAAVLLWESENECGLNRSSKEEALVVLNSPFLAMRR